MLPLHLTFKPSQQFTRLMFGLCVITGAILMPLSLAWAIKLPLWLLMIVLAVYQMYQHGWRQLPYAVVALRVDVNNVLSFQRSDGTWCNEVTIGADSVVTPYLTVLRLRPSDAHLMQKLMPTTLLILPDMLEANAFRHLRVWLRWGASSTT